MALTVASSLSVDGVDWSKLDTILLDMDGTLLDLEFDNHFWGTVIPREWGRQRGLDVKASQEKTSMETCWELTKMANIGGGGDNITSVFARLLPPVDDEETMY